MIEVESLTKSYGDVHALQGVTFTVPTGQICGYLGPNGAGKSTTIKILTGLIRPTSGRARIGGFDVVESPLDAKRLIGYTPETGAVYSTLSAHEYLALVGAVRDLDPDVVAQRSKELLRLFEISQAADRRLDALSKGMRQKVVIAAAVLHDPQAILFDEPLSGLDANAAAIVKEVVRGLANQGKTVLYCSHVLDVVERLCDRVIILHGGRMVADDKPSELKSAKNRETLESVFRSLTSQENQPQIAAEIVSAVGTASAAKTPATAAAATPAASGSSGGRGADKRKKKR